MAPTGRTQRRRSARDQSFATSRQDSRGLSRLWPPRREIISEGNLGIMQAVRRFNPNKGFRFATYAMWWIRASVREYVLRSWSPVRMGTTVNRKKLFFNRRRAKRQISALDDGDMRPGQVTKIATRLGVKEDDVVQMNRQLGGDASLNAPIGDGSGSDDWQDRLVDNDRGKEQLLIDVEERDIRRTAREALIVASVQCTPASEADEGLLSVIVSSSDA